MLKNEKVRINLYSLYIIVGYFACSADVCKTEASTYVKPSPVAHKLKLNLDILLEEPAKVIASEPTPTPTPHPCGTEENPCGTADCPCGGVGCPRCGCACCDAGKFSSSYCAVGCIFYSCTAVSDECGGRCARTYYDYTPPNPSDCAVESEHSGYVYISECAWKNVFDGCQCIVFDEVEINVKVCSDCQ